MIVKEADFEADLARYQEALGRPWLYISGPMTGKRGERGDMGPYANPREAMFYGEYAWSCGWHPIVPHTNVLWELVVGPLDPTSPDGANGWLLYDLSLLTRCEALLRVPGPSSGADREVAVAEQLGKPVIHIEDHWKLPQASDCFRRVEGRWEQLI